MAKISPLMILPPVLFGGFALLAYFGMFRDDPSGVPSTRVGNPAPAITDTALSEFPAVTSEMLRSGDVTLVNFWASWCPPCRAEHPRLLQLEAEGMRIIGVNMKDDPSDATGYLIEDDNPFFAVASDPQGRTAIDWGVTAPPETFIVDGDGVVLFRFQGPLIGSDYEQRFAPQLEAARN